MGTVVIKGAQIECGHAAKETLTGSGPMHVAQAPVLTQGAEVGTSFSACQNKTTSNPPQAWPCISTSGALPDGLSTRLTVNNKPVLLGSAHGAATAAPVDTRTWKVSKDGQATNAAGAPVLTAT
jgi:hypothetical protein